MENNSWKETLEELWGQTCRTALDLGDAAGRGAKAAGKTAETAARYAKLKLEEADLTAQVRRRLQRVGEMVYATHTGDPTDSEAMEAVLREIDGLRETLREKERQRLGLRGIRACGGCGARNDRENEYCTNCGRPLERQAEE